MDSTLCSLIECDLDASFDIFTRICFHYTRVMSDHKENSSDLRKHEQTTPPALLGKLLATNDISIGTWMTHHTP